MTANSRVLLAGDTHGNLRWLVRLCEIAIEQDCATVFQLGDFGFFPHQSHGQRFLDRVSELLIKHDLDMYFLDGNHDNHDELAKLSHARLPQVRERLRYVGRGTRLNWFGCRIGVIGGAFSIDKEFRTPGQNWWAGEEPTRSDLEKLGTDPLDVLLTHDTPERGSLRGFDLSPEMEARSAQTRDLLREAVVATRPRLVVHGHWHHRHSCTMLNGETRVEGLASDQQANAGSWAVLELAPWRFGE